MTGVDVDAVMNGLKGFQQDAVEHVIDRFYGGGRSTGSGRFLIADETGLGKSVIARGIIAQTIRELEHDDSVGRIDIVYICSNADLANQNLRRLNVTGETHLAMATRLTLLARESRKLATPDGEGASKKVNLVSFTPGTSFKEGGWRSGNADERALLCVIAEARLAVDADEATRWLFQGAVQSPGAFVRRVNDTRAKLGPEGADPSIVDRFRELVDRDELWPRFLDLREQVRTVGAPPPKRQQLSHDMSDLIAKLRRHLATAGVKALEPDLIILDEFQRFRALLDPDTEGGALADSLFREGDAKVLLLSATPFRAFTGESEVGDDHQRDFLTLIDFLADDPSRVAGIKNALDGHRLAMISNGDAAASALMVRDALLPYMSRSERPPLARNQDMVVDRPLDGGVPSSCEIADWAALSKLGDQLNARVDLEQWKSIPYFASFMDTYKSGSRVREALESDDAAVSQLLAETRGLSRETVSAQDEIDLGNGMLRALAADTIDRGWWKLLWMPPSMPYLEPGPVFSSIGDMTKHVVFSAWNGVPTAVAGLLSHDAARRAHAGSEKATDSTSGRLTWGVNDEGVPTQMSTLALFWPHPSLAEAWDPLRATREQGGRIDATAFTATAAPEGESREPSHAFFATAGAVPEGVDALSVPRFLDTGSTRFADYVHAAGEYMKRDPSSHHDLARLGAHAPGSVAYRALQAVASTNATQAGIWRAAWVLSLGLRSLFARPETAALLDTVGSDRLHYWSVVLDYCADGNLQAVMDEYVHQLRSERGGRLLDDDQLWDVASQVASAIRTNAATLRGHEATAERAAVPLATRFAVRYGGAGTDANEQVAARQSEVRAAFNSPFAPFVLASTSIGQEGIDFHWWSHAVVHWNLPSNPVDFEQREGRVHRFMGHAVRKNVAARHWDDVLSSESAAWDAAFEAAVNSSQSAGLGQFAPWWVYDGDARIHRRIASFTLSRDHAKYERLLDALTLYRLTLGQPRQEDMIRLMKQNGVEQDLAAGAIDLRPPPRPEVKLFGGDQDG
ncbi:DEAD/DEAH box helicase [Microbacterium sp.]